MTGMWENVLLALNGLRSLDRVLLLTMLGIIIGIGSVIGIMCVGDAVTGSVTDAMSALGVNNITVAVQQRLIAWKPWKSSPRRRTTCSRRTCSTRWSRRSPACWTTPSPSPRAAARPRTAISTPTSPSRASNGAYLAVNNVNLLTGRTINDRDMEGTKYVAVVSDFLVEKMFPGLSNRDALGQEVRVTLNDDIYNFTIVGVYENVDSPYAALLGTGSEADKRTDLYIPVTTPTASPARRRGSPAPPSPRTCRWTPRPLPTRPRTSSTATTRTTRTLTSTPSAWRPWSPR